MAIYEAENRTLYRAAYWAVGIFRSWQYIDKLATYNPNAFPGYNTELRRDTSSDASSRQR